MAQNDRANMRQTGTWLVGAYVVLATYTIWAIKAWHGDSINALVVAMAIIITTAGAVTVFGAKRMSGALDIVNEARGLAEEVRQLREEEEES